LGSHIPPPSSFEIEVENGLHPAPIRLTWNTSRP
jgi:hypothetical protein